MSRTSFERAVGLLGDLTSTELEQLGTRVAALRTLSGPALPPSSLGSAGRGADSAFAALLYQALADALYVHVRVQQPPFPLFLRSRAGNSFYKGAMAAEVVHGQWFPKVDRVEMLKLCRIYATCLFSYLEWRRVPVQWNTITGELHNLPEVVSHSFPGYAKSGLLSMMLLNKAGL